jgi:hypothetical protein
MVLDSPRAYFASCLDGIIREKKTSPKVSTRLGSEHDFPQYNAWSDGTRAGMNIWAVNNVTTRQTTLFKADLLDFMGSIIPTNDSRPTKKPARKG